MSLTSDILSFAKKALSTSEGVIVKVRTEVSDSIINKTPLDTMNPGDGGQAKASWEAKIGSKGQSNKSARDKTGDTTKEKAKQVAMTNIAQDFYLTSTCEYIGVLEYGGYPNPVKKGTYLSSKQSKDGVSGPGYHKFSVDGYSKQAPHGMVRITIADFQNIVDEVVKGLK